MTFTVSAGQSEVDAAAEAQARQQNLQDSMLIDFFCVNAANERIESAYWKLQQRNIGWYVQLDHYQQYVYPRDLLYTEFPFFYVWQSKWWLSRKVLTKPVVTRMYHVSPLEEERFHLRLLLSVRGPTSFEDLRTVEGVLQPTFKDACMALGLVQNDASWVVALRDAVEYAMPPQLRQIFDI